MMINSNTVMTKIWPMLKEEKREMVTDQLSLMPLDSSNLNLENSENMFLTELMKLRKLTIEKIVAEANLI